MTKQLLDRCALVRSSFFVFMDRDEDKNAKREPGQYSAILTKQACSIRDLLYGIPRLRVALWFLLLGLPVFVANCILETRQDFWFLCFHCRWHLKVFLFFSSIQREKFWKIFLLSWKIFCKRTLLCTWLDFGEFFFAGTKQALPSGQYCSLLYGKLRVQTRWTKSCTVIGYLSGQDGVILPAQDCPFCSHNDIPLKSKQVLESVRSQNIFGDSKKVFFYFSVRIELGNEKIETCHHFCK